MTYCKCGIGKTTRMEVKKNGVTVKDGETMGGTTVSVSEGDLLECPVCGNQVVTNFGKAYFIGKVEWDRIPNEFKFEAT